MRDRLRACLGGVPVGAIRISVGMANVEADVTRVIAMLKELGASLPRTEAHAAALAA